MHNKNSGLHGLNCTKVINTKSFPNQLHTFEGIDMGSQFANKSEAELLLDFFTLLPAVILGVTEKGFEEMEHKYDNWFFKALKYFRIDCGLSVVLFSLNIICVCLTLIFCKNFMRLILLLKALSVALQCICKTTSSAIALKLYDVDEELKHYRTISTSRLEDGLIFLERIFEGFHFAMTFFLHFELYKLICKLERLKNSNIRIIKIAGIALLSIALVVGADEGARALFFHFHPNPPIQSALTKAMPLFSVILSGFCLTIYYFDFHIANALQNSSNFRQKFNPQDYKDYFEFIFVVLKLTGFFHFVYTVLFIVESIWESVTQYTITKCVEEAKTIFKSALCVSQSSQESFIREIIMRSTWSQFFEQIILNIIIIRKSFKTK